MKIKIGLLSPKSENNEAVPISDGNSTKAGSFIVKDEKK